MSKKYLYEILVPKSSPAKPISLKHHKEWDRKVTQISAGLTVLQPTKVGYWISPDNILFREQMIPVRIYCSAEEIKKIADITADHYNQRAVMYYRLSTEVKIIYYEE